MLAEIEPIETIVRDVYDQSPPNPDELFQSNVVVTDEPGIRPNSASTEDTGFGDSRKGRVKQQLNFDLIRRSPSGLLYSERYNGTGNAGHEIYVNGIRIALHQLPVASVQEGAVAILGRGMLVHPGDLVMEINYVEKKIGSKLPARILIDKNVTVITDIHRAYETYINNLFGAGEGNTSSGVSMGYASYYEKRAITMADLMSDDWREKFTEQYKSYARLMGGEDRLAASTVKRLTLEGKKEEQVVGNLQEFLRGLEEARVALRTYVADVRDEVETIWRYHPDIPFTFESAQGPLLDPYGGLYPDITASRPNAIVGISDSTEGVVQFKEIALKIAVLKTPYMSSVGARIPPYSMDPNIAEMYRRANDETGKSTGRDRGIYPIDLVTMRAARKVSQYDFIAITHFDSNYPNIPIEVVVDYVSKATHKKEPYRPYQWHWDQVEGKVVHLPSWDGEKVAQAETVYELPNEALQLINVVNKVLAPVVMVTNGPKLGETIFLTK